MVSAVFHSPARVPFETTGVARVTRPADRTDRQALSFTPRLRALAALLDRCCAPLPTLSSSNSGECSWTVCTGSVVR